MSNKYVVVDLETTGNSPKKGDQIIQLAAVVIENGQITEQYASLVQPSHSIPPFIEELTGLTDEMVATAPKFSEIAKKVEQMLEGAYFVAHNVLFDLSFLQEEFKMAGLAGFYGPIIDTVELARIFLPSEDSYKLSDLSLNLGLSHERPHQADSDAYVTAELLLILEQKMKSLPLLTLKQLKDISFGLKSDLDLYLDDWIQWKEESHQSLPSNLEINHGIALRKSQNKQVGKLNKSGILYPYTKEEKEAYLQKVFKPFESREGQYQMMDAVYKAFISEQHSLIEAGTGVGKSLAYLLPSIIFSLQENERIVISTFTTQLQDQLLQKDLPLLTQMIPMPIKASILKGRNHYISLAKFIHTLRSHDDNYDTCLTKMQILVWLTETTTGDVDELNLSSGGQLYWNQIKNNRMLFINDKDFREKDFYNRAKKQAESAQLIITNHSMLLSDTISDYDILPSYQYAIIDEAHHFVKAASPYFGRMLDFMTVRLTINKLGLFEQKEWIFQLEQLLEEVGVSNEVIHSFEVNEMMESLHREMDEFFYLISKLVQKSSPKKSKLVRVKMNVQNLIAKYGRQIDIQVERFSSILKEVIQMLTARLHAIQNGPSPIAEKSQPLLEDVSSAVRELEGYVNSLHFFFKNSQNFPLASWVEVDLRAIQNVTSIYAEPLDVSERLSQSFFTKKKSVVLASATMTVNQSFQYMEKELGLEGLPCTSQQIPSPFQYERQVKMIIPKDLPDIKTVKMEEYIASIAEQIISIAEVTKGRMLILFTSFEMLKETYQLIKESDFLSDYAIFAQGISGGSRSRLTRNFQKFDKAILLGASSFWEGVDIPGEDLSCLIIVRLPFAPPDDPVASAKAAKMKRDGGNPFKELAIPEAVIRFKQGFGRLIRSNTDRGVVIVFDRRIKTASYGKAFLQSIPSVEAKECDLNETIHIIEQWL